MIVHLFEDQKFVDITIENFENVSNGLNKYIVFSNNDKLTYVSRKEDVIILPNSSYKLDIDLVYKDCQLLIIHFLSPLKLYILKHKPHHVKVIWSVWGSDAYDHFKVQNNFEPITSVTQKSTLFQKLKDSYFFTFYHLMKYRIKPLSKELELLQLIDYVITVLPNEFKVVKNEFGLVAKYIDYNYGINNFDKFSDRSLGNSILVGNSATSTNNHLDVFEIIKSTTNMDIIVPLSYGAYDYEDYKENIISEGRRIFNKNFLPIENFMNLHDYRELTFSCNTVIMYHIRQQALANIFMSLFQGMRLFLNSKSITYSFLKDQGMIVFDLKKDYKLIGVELNEDDKQINKQLVLNLTSRKVIKEKTKGIINLYYSFINSTD
jgi:hypothetical protein